MTLTMQQLNAPSVVSNLFSSSRELAGIVVARCRGNDASRANFSPRRFTLACSLSRRKFRSETITGWWGSSCRSIDHPASVVQTENALDALDRGVCPAIEAACTNFPDDEDLAMCGCRILWAISEAVKEEMDFDRVPKLQNEGGTRAVVAIVSRSPTDSQTIEDSMKYLDNLASMGMTIDGASLAPGMVNIFTKRGTVKAKTGKKITAALAIVAKTPEGAAALNGVGGITTLFTYCLANGDMSEDSVEMMEGAFDACKFEASNGQVEPGALEQAIACMEKYRAKNSATAKGSAALAAMVSPEKLDQCLQTLKSASPGSPEHDEALTTLGSMSYISSFTDGIVRAGGIPMLCELINSGLTQLESNPEKIGKMIAGASRMLGRIASNPSNVDAVVEAGGMVSMCTALTYCTEDGDCLAALCLALVPLAKRETNAQEMIQYQTFPTILPILYAKVENIEVAEAAMELVSCASQHSSLQQHMIDSQAVEICATCCQYHTENSMFQLHAISALNRLSPQLSTLAHVYEYGGLGGVCTSLQANTDSEAVSLVAVQLLESFSQVPDAKEYMIDGNIVDAILQAMLEYENCENLINSGIRCLGVIASDSDVQRHLGNLETATSNAKNDPDRVYNILAAISGLARVSHLSATFEQLQTSATIVKAMQGWIEGTRFEGQSRIIKAGIKTVKILKLIESSDLSPTIQALCDTASLPQLKRIVELEEPDNNVLVFFSAGVRDLAAADRIHGQENIELAVESILKVMRKYPDSRRTQINCLEALNYLAMADNGEGVQALVRTGCIKAIVAYLLRTPVYLDAQIAGFTILASCAKADPSTVEIMKKCDCLQALKVSMRTHAKSKELKRTVAPLLALMMPTDMLEKEIRERLEGISTGMAEGNPAGVHENLEGLNELLVSAEGSKIAARCGVGGVLAAVQPWIQANAPNYEAVDYELSGRELHHALISETAQALEQTASTRVGKVHLTKNSNIETAVALYESLEKPLVAISAEAASHSLEAVKQLLKHDRTNADIAFQRGFVGTLCEGVDVFDGDPAVLSGTCACLGAMCTSPKRVEQLVAQPEFGSLLEKLMKIIEEDPKKEIRMQAMSAVQGFLETRDQTMSSKVAEAGAVRALFKVIDENHTDSDMVTQAARCLALSGEMIELRDYYDGDVRWPVQVLTTALSDNKNNAQTSVNLLDVMNRITTADDKAALKESGAMEQVAEVMMLHFENEEVTRIGGELFAKMGADEQIKALMLQIIQAVESGEPDSLTKVDQLSGRLAMFLAAPLEDPNDALQHTNECLAALSTALANSGDNSRLQGNIAAVTRRLCDRCYDDYNDEFGAWAVAKSGVLTQYSNMIAAGSVDKNKKFISPAYRTLAACSANPYTFPAVEALGPEILPHTYSLLEMHKNDPEVVARILEFLKNFAEQPGGAAQIMENMKSDSGGDLAQLTMSLMNQHKKNDAVAIEGMGLMGALALGLAQTEGATAPACLSDGTVIRECQALCDANFTEQREMAYLGMIEKMLQSGAYNNQIVGEKVIERIVKRVKHESEEKRLSDGERANLNAAMAKALQAGGEFGLIAEIEKAKGFEALMQAIEDHPDSPQVIASVDRSLAALAVADQNMMVRCAKEAVPKLCAEASATIQTDPVAAETFADLLVVLAQTEGIGRQLLDVEGLEETLQGVTNLADYYGDEFGESLKAKVALIRKAMEDDQPREKTCKDVYDILFDRSSRDLSVSVEEAAILQEEIAFLFSQMGMYGLEKLNHETAMGADHQYGNMAYEILATHPSNVRPMIDGGYTKQTLASFKNQKDEEIVLYAVKSLNTFCKNAPGAQEVARTAAATAIITDTLSRMRGAKDYENEKKEEHLNARILCIERTAINRNLYNKTKVMSVLIACWNDYDKGMYSTTLLRHVFRAMRRVVSDAHVAELLEANVLQRLIAIIDDKDADLALLPDVLFLLGSLAVVPEIKTKIGELRGIQACVELLKRCLPVQEATAVITNSSLALANICIGHKKNTEVFANLKGPDLNVSILNQRGNEYDVANAGSVMLCNLLYKNESMKKTYGTNGAPAALVYALQQYDGSEEKSAIRCLESLFKAISNLSLYTPNIQPFLDAGIEHSYRVWLENLSETFPDAQLETGCRTLANLVMENEEKNMRKFGVCLQPTMQVSKQGRQDTKVLLLLLDIQASLCRLKENAVVFSEAGGIETTIRMIHQFDYDVSLLTLGIHLLGIQASIPESIPRLMEADVFSILVGCIEVDAEGNEVIELVVGGLRCTRRIIQDQNLAYEYCNAGGIATIANIICKSIGRPMVMLESTRVLLGLLNYTTPSAQDRAAAQAELVPDENGEIPAEQAENPLLYGGWYNMGMDEVMVGAILQALMASAATEGHAKQLRLQRVSLGAAAYFAHEQVGGDSLVSSGFERCAVQALETFPTELTILQSVCTTINNIATTSGDLYESIRTKELISALKSSVSKLPNKKPEEKEKKAVIQATLDALSSSQDPFDAFANCNMAFSFEPTFWNQDPYPNGVHDLPAAVKDALRKGGRFKVFLGDKEREEMKWRASQDLNALEWSAGNDHDYSNRVPIVRIRNVTKGLSHPALQKAAKKEPRKVTAKLCLCINGPPTEDNINGLELPIKTKNEKERDGFVEMLVQWRDAASYNF